METEGATPLALRPTKPLELAPQPHQESIGWKVAAVVALLGGAAVFWHKRGKTKAIDPGQLTIVRRTSVGLRSELLVVNVEGQRLLIGVTPQSIQSLAILDADETLAAEAPSVATSVSARVDAVLDAAQQARPVRSRGASRVSPLKEADDEELGQARGLLGLRRRG